jgi:DNA-binding NtrC family response regulator
MERGDAMMPFKENPPLRPNPSSPSPQRVLLVDEDEEDLRYFSTLLGRMGYSVRAFVDHRAAVECLEHGYFDLVILSQVNPARETHRLVEFTLGRDRHTPVVVLTCCLDISCYLRATQLGATDYRVKPLTPGEFERVVKTHCQPRHGQITTNAS